MRELHTVAEAVDLLGGNRVVAELTGHKYDSVISNWKKRGSFPSNTYAVLKSAILTRGASAPDSLWGMASVAPEPEHAA